MTPLEHTIDKRRLFVTMGCAQWPYQKIKDELFAGRDKLDIHQVLALPLPADDKVVILQELSFFEPVTQRLLALRFAANCYRQALGSLTAADIELASSALDFLQAVMLGDQDKHDYPALHTRLLTYLVQELRPLDYTPNRLRIGVFDAILCVLRPSAYQALREASSVQRYLFGVEKADEQLRDMARLIANYFD